MDSRVPNANIPTLCDHQHAFLNDQLTRANDSRLHLDQLLWLLFSIAFGANALLLGAWSQIHGSQFHDSILNSGLITLIVSIFGILLCAGWFFAQEIIIGYYNEYEDLVHSLEDKLIKLRVPYSDDDDIRLMSKSRYPYKRKRWIHAAPLVCVVIWVFVFCVYFYQIFQIRI